MLKHTVVTALTFVLMTAVLHAPAVAAPKVLKFSCLEPETSLETKLLREYFVKDIEENSNGRYKIDMYPGSSLGNTDTVVQGLNMGTIHLAFDSASNLSQFAPKLAIFDLPYMFTREELAKVMDSPAGNKLKAETRNFGVQIINFIAAFQRNLISRKPFHTVAEMEGAKARSTNSKWHIFGLQALGFKPIPMAAAEMLTGIQQGVVDCMDIAISAMYGYHVYDVAKNIILTDQTNICTTLFTSAEWWDSLPQADKQIITEAANAYRTAITEAFNQSQAKFIRLLKDGGCDVYTLPESERNIWRQKVYKEYQHLPEDMLILFKELRAAADA
ncbi:TRAP transporter substrate-binding protein [uncultured Mailhella sp.]|uniref:TRAP transporter substrate-binding protein n=1 Tax=uncultured Mailhella sp. TaxID=1981031 RepID=UPI002613A3F5|nr:TRAP transporter substrate-binding protein [uncultured Mailhella sp.]